MRIPRRSSIWLNHKTQGLKIKLTEGVKWRNHEIEMDDNMVKRSKCSEREWWDGLKPLSCEVKLGWDLASDWLFERECEFVYR